ncbi:hypothetical protein OUZ56_007063 [Daphnia magna]|uniref:Uncharacterized protein n=1 Tax=Daphnia magna TaxID=35525 RepID=A0ABQ9YXH3_9CRUS|nr:hypothetical protein OUZ56_007063 [Daphnia magna]
MDRFSMAGFLTSIQCDLGATDSQAGLLQTAFIIPCLIFPPVGYLLLSKAIASHIYPVVCAIWFAVVPRGGSLGQQINKVLIFVLSPFSSSPLRHRFIAAFAFTIVSSPSLLFSSPRRCRCLRHRLVAVFACAIASSWSLPAPSPSPRRCLCLRHRHRLVAVFACLVVVFAFTSSPSSPSLSPSPSFHCCLRFCRHLIAVFNFAIGSSPSSSLPISSPVAYNDGTIGSRKKLERVNPLAATPFAPHFFLAYRDRPRCSASWSIAMGWSSRNGLAERRFRQCTIRDFSLSMRWRIPEGVHSL